MLALYILLGLLGLVVLLVLAVLFLPAYGYITYDGHLKSEIYILGTPFDLISDEDVAEAVEKKKKKKKSKLSKVRELGHEVKRSFDEDGVGSTLAYLRAVIKEGGHAVGKILHAARVDKLKLDMVIGGEDAAETAVHYGEVCSVLYPALTAFYRLVPVRRRAIRVEPNFLAEESDVRFDVRFHIWIYRMGFAVIALLVRVLLLDEDLADNLITDKEAIKHGES